MWRVVTDSTMDLPQDLVEKYGIVVVPIRIHFGEETYLDKVDLSEDDFYRLIEERGIIPKTSQVTPGQLVEAYERLYQEGIREILSIHISSHLSGSYDSAVQAARMVAHKIRVIPFDSLSGSGGLGFMALEAAKMALEGKPLKRALQRLERMRDAMRIYLMLDNLKFPQMSGRVTFVQQVVASMLRLKMIVAVRAGHLVPTDKVRTRQRALDRLVQLVAEEYDRRPLHIGSMHAKAPETMQRLLNLARKRLNVVSEITTSLATSVAVHLGPGTVGIVAYPADLEQ